MKFFRLLKILCFSCVILFTCVSCSAKEPDLYDIYGEDAKYFLALKVMPQDLNKAERLLKRSMNKASPVIARTSFEKYASLGSMQERIKRYISYYNKYSDEDALLLLANELYKDEEYTKLLFYTDTIDVKKCNNEIVSLRCSALLEKNDARFEKEFSDWCLYRTFTSEHYKFYCKLPDTSDEIKFRAYVYSQDYAKAADAVRNFFEENSSYTITPYLMSDIGKALLYGSTNHLQNAWFLQGLATSLPEECNFYAWFYSGRLFDKAGSYYSLSLNNFRKAMDTSFSDLTYDNALWYLLTTTLKNSSEEAVKAVNEYKASWHDASYFDDFFDTLCVRLFSTHKWELFYEIAKETDGYASDETVAKYSYIAARLIQEGFLKFNEDNKRQTISQLLVRAVSSGSDLYYKLSAAAQLNYSHAGLIKRIYPMTDLNNFKRNVDAEKLLCGYADFGFAEQIYPVWQKYSSELGIDCVKKISTFLKNCGSEENEYYTQSLRIAAKKALNPEAFLDEEMLSLVFPRDFNEYVTQCCTRFDLPEFLLYALIRSESFFNPVVKSHAGAIGLTQLMEPTANDIAKKLKIADFDLTNSSTNILFGAYYLEEMRRRSDNSNILALFSYNAGISHVRTWVKSANLEYGAKSLPRDLFLEALPFGETREYGRKLVSAAAIYGYLYYNESIYDVVSEILN